MSWFKQFYLLTIMSAWAFCTAHLVIWLEETLQTVVFSYFVFSNVLLCWNISLRVIFPELTLCIVGKEYSVLFDFWKQVLHIKGSAICNEEIKVGLNWRWNEKQSNQKKPFDETLRTDWKTLKVFIFAAFGF